MAHFHRQDPALPTVRALLVMADGGQNAVAIERAAGLEAEVFEDAVDSIGKRGVSPAALGNCRDGPQAQRNGGAVSERVIALCLERVAQRVAEVEDAPLMLFEWVAIDDP